MDSGMEEWNGMEWNGMEWIKDICQDTILKVY